MNTIYILLGAISVFASDMRLDQYLELVKKTDKGIQGALASHDSAKNLEELHRVATTVGVFSQANLLSDGRPTTNPTAQGTKTVGEALAVGLTQKTGYGINWTISQNINKTKIYGVSPLFIPVAEYYDTFPKVEATVNLWKNFAGRQIQFDSQKLYFDSQAQIENSLVQVDQKIINAEMAYWQYYYTKELYDIYTDNLKRAEKLVAWTSERRRKNFAENTDVLQAEAAMAMRKLEVQNSELQLADAARAFNSLRGIEGDIVRETLVATPIPENRLTANAKQLRERRDLKATALNSSATKMGMESARESLTPNLDFNLTYAGYGRDPDYSKAQQNILSKPYWAVGLVFSTSLDIGLIKKIRQGYAGQAMAQEFAKEKTDQEMQLAWEHTLDQGKQIYNQLHILWDLEALQQKKSNEERNNFLRGKTTTFQVLNFEQDYINSRAQRISAEMSARQFIANLKLFEGL